MTDSLWNEFEGHARRRPASLAVSDGGWNYTYENVLESAVAFAQWLESVGTAPGDRVVLLLQNSIHYVSFYLGTLKAGCVVVALDPEISTPELTIILDDCRPGVVVLGGQARKFHDCIARLNQRLGVIRSVVALADESEVQVAGHPPSSENGQAGAREGHTLPRKLRDLAQIIYTSGTTGRPKGVMLTHRNLMANCQSIIQYLSLSDRDTVLVVLPFHFCYGNSLLTTHLAVGGRLVLAAERDVEARLDLLESDAVTGLAGVPATFAEMLSQTDLHERSFRTLRYVTCAGGHLSAEQCLELSQAFSGVELYLMYGQTEATARLSALMPNEVLRKPGSIGRGIPGVTLSVLDERGHRVPLGTVGEIVARGHNVMLGYWNDPQGTEDVIRPEGLRTGDLGYADEEGFLYVVGRKGDMIKSGAYRISPHEIEDILLRHPLVEEVAVVGHPDDLWGEVPVAFVVPQNGEVVDVQALSEVCRKQLPTYKQPERIEIVDSVPRTTNGKTLRTTLREMVGVDH